MKYLKGYAIAGVVLSLLVSRKVWLVSTAADHATALNVASTLLTSFLIGYGIVVSIAFIHGFISLIASSIKKFSGTRANKQTVPTCSKPASEVVIDTEVTKDAAKSSCHHTEGLPLLPLVDQMKMIPDQNELYSEEPISDYETVRQMATKHIKECDGKIAEVSSSPVQEGLYGKAIRSIQIAPVLISRLNLLRLLTMTYSKHGDYLREYELSLNEVCSALLEMQSLEKAMESEGQEPSSTAANQQALLQKYQELRRAFYETAVQDVALNFQALILLYRSSNHIDRIAKAIAPMEYWLDQIPDNATVAISEDGVDSSAKYMMGILRIKKYQILKWSIDSGMTPSGRNFDYESGAQDVSYLVKASTYIKANCFFTLWWALSSGSSKKESGPYFEKLKAVNGVGHLYFRYMVKRGLHKPEAITVRITDTTSSDELKSHFRLAKLQRKSDAITTERMAFYIFLGLGSLVALLFLALAALNAMGGSKMSVPSAGDVLGLLLMCYGFSLVVALVSFLIMSCEDVKYAPLTKDIPKW